MSETVETREEWCEVPRYSGAMSLFVATPRSGGPWPICVVAGELFGLTGYVKDAVRRIAAMGYVAVAPDLFHRAGPRIALPYDADGRARGFALFAELSRDRILSDVSATLSALRGRDDASPRAAMVGFSIGGHLAILAAQHLDIAAAVAFYPGWLLAETAPFAQPAPAIQSFRRLAERDAFLLLLCGEVDPVLPPPDMDAIRAVLQGCGARFETVAYPGVGHGFDCPARSNFDADASQDAWRRMTLTLAQALRRQPVGSL